MTEPDYSEAEIEAGRLLFAGDWDFVSAASSVASLPEMKGLEIAFVGRSNVGKSSLINALAGRRAMARTSNTPGRTQELIFFAGQGPLVLVDMPGYGHASAAKSKIAAWTRLIHDYLRGRRNLARVYVLLDARRGPMAADAEMFKLLDRAAVSYQLVLTKSDCIGPPELAARLGSLQTLLARRPAAYPEVAVTSARTGIGIAQLRAAIGRLLRERDQAPPGADLKH